MWINHHRLFTYIGRVDHTLLVLNALLLLGVTFIPFPTAVVAAHLGHEGGKVAAAFYSSAFEFIALGFNALWRYASWPRRGPSLLRVESDHPGVLKIHQQYLFGPYFYLVAFGFAFWNEYASVTVILALALFFALPPRHRARR